MHCYFPEYDTVFFQGVSLVLKFKIKGKGSESGPEKKLQANQNYFGSVSKFVEMIFNNFYD